MARHVSGVSYMNIQARTVKNIGDGEQTTTHAKQILKVLLLLIETEGVVLVCWMVLIEWV